MKTLPQVIPMTKEEKLASDRRILANVDKFHIRSSGEKHFTISPKDQGGVSCWVCGALAHRACSDIKTHKLLPINTVHAQRVLTAGMNVRGL